jgi:DNA-binding NarL/FixJ family response regulator
MDIGMPEMNGIEATREIKKRWPDINVLVLTAYEDDEYVFAFVDAGAAGYLLKDVPAEEVVRAVRAVHAGEPVLHPTVMRKLMARISGQPASAPGESLDVEYLSERETEVLTQAAHGFTNALIGDKLGLSPRTVQTHMRNIFAKLRVSSRTEAVVAAVRRGVVDISDD